MPALCFRFVIARNHGENLLRFAFRFWIARLDPLSLRFALVPGLLAPSNTLGSCGSHLRFALVPGLLAPGLGKLTRRSYLRFASQKTGSRKVSKAPGTVHHWNLPG